MKRTALDMFRRELSIGDRCVYVRSGKGGWTTIIEVADFTPKMTVVMELGCDAFSKTWKVSETSLIKLTQDGIDAFIKEDIDEIN